MSLHIVTGSDYDRDQGNLLVKEIAAKSRSHRITPLLSMINVVREYLTKPSIPVPTPNALATSRFSSLSIGNWSGTNMTLRNPLLPWCTYIQILFFHELSLLLDRIWAYTYDGHLVGLELFFIWRRQNQTRGVTKWNGESIASITLVFE